VTERDLMNRSNCSMIYHSFQVSISQPLTYGVTESVILKREHSKKLNISESEKKNLTY
jgi:hypothetical protein